MEEIKNIYCFIDRYQQKNPDGHFFDDKTLKFFGERKSEMRIFKNPEVITDISGEEHTCYVISSLQRKNPLGPKRVYHYFDTETFRQIIM